MRVSRGLAAGLLFSVTIHLGALVFWKWEPAPPRGKVPGHMVVRLIAASREAGGAGAAEEPEEIISEPSRAVQAPRLRSFRAAAARGAVPTWPVQVHPAAGPSRTRGRARAEGPARGGAVYSAAATVVMPRAAPQGPVSRHPDPLAEIRRRIETHKSYPGLARHRGWEGDVVVELQLDGGGEISEVKLVEKSGHGVLDRATLLAVRKAGPYPPLPGRVRVPVSYRLAQEYFRAPSPSPEGGEKSGTGAGFVPPPPRK